MAWDKTDNIQHSLDKSRKRLTGAASAVLAAWYFDVKPTPDSTALVSASIDIRDVYALALVFLVYQLFQYILNFLHLSSSKLTNNVTIGDVFGSIRNQFRTAFRREEIFAEYTKQNEEKKLKESLTTKQAMNFLASINSIVVEMLVPFVTCSPICLRL